MTRTQPHPETTYIFLSLIIVLIVAVAAFGASFVGPTSTPAQVADINTGPSMTQPIIPVPPQTTLQNEETRPTQAPIR
jgi:hypothetical protein